MKIGRRISSGVPSVTAGEIIASARGIIRENPQITVDSLSQLIEEKHKAPYRELCIAAICEDSFANDNFNALLRFARKSSVNTHDLDAFCMYINAQEHTSLNQVIDQFIEDNTEESLMASMIGLSVASYLTAARYVNENDEAFIKELADKYCLGTELASIVYKEITDHARARVEERR